MTYRILHRTAYSYKYPVSVGSHVACLTPRSSPHHRLSEHSLQIEPAPATIAERTDFFGNRLCVFTVQQPHRELTVESRGLVEVEAARVQQRGSLPWEEAVRRLAAATEPGPLEACQYTFESPRIRPRVEYAHYARASFTPGRPLAEALRDLTSRIHADFRFDAKVTNVRTTTEEVFKKRRGVCQDFAHLEIACLRSLGLAARYVSGYLRTYPPPGRPRLIGADASHAWVSAWCPASGEDSHPGWLDLDPTNNLVPTDGHVTIAWGRDYGDVSPLRGLILGGGAHTLKVGVDMEPLEG